MLKNSYFVSEIGFHTFCHLFKKTIFRIASQRADTDIEDIDKEEEEEEDEDKDSDGSENKDYDEFETDSSKKD